MTFVPARSFASLSIGGGSGRRRDRSLQEALRGDRCRTISPPCLVLILCSRSRLAPIEWSDRRHESQGGWNRPLFSPCFASPPRQQEQPASDNDRVADDDRQGGGVAPDEETHQRRPQDGGILQRGEHGGAGQRQRPGDKNVA